MYAQLSRNRDPRTKEELLDRMLSYDFNGDIRLLGKSPASLTRISPNKLLLSFGSGRTFELTVRLPRDLQSGERPVRVNRPHPMAAFVEEDETPTVTEDEMSAAFDAPDPDEPEGEDEFEDDEALEAVGPDGPREPRRRRDPRRR